MLPKDIENVTDDARALVDAFVFEHRSAAIPALIGACVLWAVEHGGADVITGSLRNAVKLTAELSAEMRRQAQ